MRPPICDKTAPPHLENPGSATEHGSATCNLQFRFWFIFQMPTVWVIPCKKYIQILPHIIHFSTISVEWVPIFKHGRFHHALSMIKNFRWNKLKLDRADMPGITDEEFMNINHILLLLYGYLSTAWAMDYSPCEDHNKWNDALNRYLPLEYRGRLDGLMKK